MRSVHSGKVGPYGTLRSTGSRENYYFRSDVPRFHKNSWKSLNGGAMYDYKLRGEFGCHSNRETHTKAEYASEGSVYSDIVSVINEVRHQRPHRKQKALWEAPDYGESRLNIQFRDRKLGWNKGFAALTSNLYGKQRPSATNSSGPYFSPRDGQGAMDHLVETGPLSSMRSSVPRLPRLKTNTDTGVGPGFVELSSLDIKNTVPEMDLGSPVFRSMTERCIPHKKNDAWSRRKEMELRIQREMKFAQEKRKAEVEHAHALEMEEKRMQQIRKVRAIGKGMTYVFDHKPKKIVTFLKPKEEDKQPHPPLLSKDSSSGNLLRRPIQRRPSTLTLTDFKIQEQERRDEAQEKAALQRKEKRLMRRASKASATSLSTLASQGTDLSLGIPKIQDSD